MKKVFTLIELLAVIVILAIIALIATPIILNIIEDSRKQSMISSANLYVDGLVKQIATKNLTNAFNPSSCTVSSGNVTCDGQALEYNVTGKKPDSGSITFNNGVVSGYTLNFGDYIVTKGPNGISVTKAGSVEFNGTIVAPDDGDTYKGIVYMDPTDLSATCNAQLAAANVNEHWTPTGINSGCMKFYIYDDSGSNYKLILDHNISTNVAWFSEEEFFAAGGTQTDLNNEDFSHVTVTPVTVNASLLEDTEGWVGNPRLITADEIAHIVGADTALGWNSNKDFVWYDENFNPAMQVTSFLFDGGGTTYEEWLNAENDFAPIATSSNKSRYAWLYDYTFGCEYYGCHIEDNNYYPDITPGYWTSTSSHNNVGAYAVSNGSIWADLYTWNYGIRPVVELPKSTLGSIPAPVTTHKGIVYLDPTNLSRTCTASDVASNVNEYGTPTGVKTGCMKFYIYDDSGSNYKMILDHNTSSPVAWVTRADFYEAGGTEADWNDWDKRYTKGPITANRRLATDTAGWVGNPRLISADEIAHIIGADTAFGWDSSKTDENWIIFDGAGTTYEEWTSTALDSTAKSAYAWLYNYTYDCSYYNCTANDNNYYQITVNDYYTVPSPYNDRMYAPVYGYWTSSSTTTGIVAWRVRSDGLLNDNCAVDTCDDFGVRPVITLPKTSVTVH